ncbi:fructosamine kinase family protein [Aureitalea sp. L0-47]|uniref:fructosamine kinase family protein n=1 Tax=Aureitalea sp. L0-47 TaxID=2816962 RepID=UPI002238ABA6|nr:fructosamine kinase family protein [Aureitalea sp. L0-47]
MESLLRKIAENHGLNIQSHHRLFGGDINTVVLLECANEKIVAKINSEADYPRMFSAERQGLELLGQTNTLRIPKVIGHGVIEDDSFLLLEYIPSAARKNDFWIDFGQNLARLHKHTRDSFGLDIDNYIGSLPQPNSSATTPTDFYITQRLEPQFKMAQDSGKLSFETDGFYKTVSEIIPDEPPALIHGDLWNGNYMVDIKGEPVLIDPAVAYSIREMDLGMMQLFGGFPEEVFSAYNEVYPLVSEWRERTSLWQLYYLLVHLNLFGSGYLGQVKSAIAKYS